MKGSGRWPWPRAPKRTLSACLKKRRVQSPGIPGVPGHPFYGKRVVLAGALFTPENREAVERAGGRVEREVTSRTDYIAVPAPGDKALPGRSGGPALLPQGAFYRLLGWGRK